MQRRLPVAQQQGAEPFDDLGRRVLQRGDDGLQQSRGRLGRRLHRLDYGDDHQGATTAQSLVKDGSGRGHPHGDELLGCASPCRRLNLGRRWAQQNTLEDFQLPTLPGCQILRIVLSGVRPDRGEGAGPGQRRGAGLGAASEPAGYAGNKPPRRPTASDFSAIFGLSHCRGKSTVVPCDRVASYRLHLAGGATRNNDERERPPMSEWFDAEEHADRALEMYERGRWAEAEAELRKALSLNPHQGEWHFNLGLTLEAAGREAEALTCYERTISLMPGQIDPLMAAGIVANHLGQFDRAVELLQEALRIDPECEAAYAHLIESHLRLGAHDEAETAFYLAQQALPESSAHCLATMAESLMQRAAYGRAEWCLREALRLDPTIPRLRARLGAVYAATGRHRRALQMYLRDLRSDPGNIDTLLDFGELLVEMGRMPEAA
ncbi:MAG: tetratricopeptide repeat protein, partial [Dehalococcoidia bacterium]